MAEKSLNPQIMVQNLAVTDSPIGSDKNRFCSIDPRLKLLLRVPKEQARFPDTGFANDDVLELEVARQVGVWMLAKKVVSFKENFELDYTIWAITTILYLTLCPPKIFAELRQYSGKPIFVSKTLPWVVNYDWIAIISLGAGVNLSIIITYKQPVWPDWAIFTSSCQQIVTQKKHNYFGVFLCYF